LVDWRLGIRDWLIVDWLIEKLDIWHADLAAGYTIKQNNEHKNSCDYIKS
jgi:hypothetical protein